MLWLTSRENSESVVCAAKPSLKLDRVRGGIWLRYAPLLTRSIKPPLTRLCDSLKQVVLLKPVRSTNCLSVTTSSGKLKACKRRQARTTASTISGSLSSILYLRSSILDLGKSGLLLQASYKSRPVRFAHLEVGFQPLQRVLQGDVNVASHRFGG